MPLGYHGADGARARREMRCIQPSCVLIRPQRVSLDVECAGKVLWHRLGPDALPPLVRGTGAASGDCV